MAESDCGVGKMVSMTVWIDGVLWLSLGVFQWLNSSLYGCMNGYIWMAVRIWLQR